LLLKNFSEINNFSSEINLISSETKIRAKNTFLSIKERERFKNVEGI